MQSWVAWAAIHSHAEKRHLLIFTTYTVEVKNIHKTVYMYGHIFVKYFYT